MDLAKVLAELRGQRDRIDEAIASLERLAEARPRGRGRPRGSKSPVIKRPTAVTRDGRERIRLAKESERS